MKRIERREVVGFGHARRSLPSPLDRFGGEGWGEGKAGEKA